MAQKRCKGDIITLIEDLVIRLIQPGDAIGSLMKYRVHYSYSQKCAQTVSRRLFCGRLFLVSFFVKPLQTLEETIFVVIKFIIYKNSVRSLQNKQVAKNSTINIGHDTIEEELSVHDESFGLKHSWISPVSFRWCPRQIETLRQLWSRLAVVFQRKQLSRFLVM